MSPEPSRPSLPEPVDRCTTHSLIRALKALRAWYRRQPGSEAGAAAAHLDSTLRHHPLRHDLIRDWQEFGADDS